MKLQETIRKILREETIQDKVNNLIKRHGIKNASKVFGGVDKLIKLLNLDDKGLDRFIYQYLTENMYPDYKWSPEDRETQEQIKRNIKSYGTQTFYINDTDAYSYFGEWDGYDNLYLVVINKWVKDELISIFGNKWIPTFKRWFEDNSGLEVREIDLEGRFLHEY
jgi:hypothetical protein